MDQSQFVKEVRQELTDNILRFWADNMVDPQGGFYGKRCSDGSLEASSEKGLILNARILWTFSSAYRILKDAEYLALADRARDEIVNRFIDRTFGGAYWSLDAAGNPLSTKKQYYAIAFAVYGLAEHFRATGSRISLDAAISLFQSIEEHSFDGEKNGYIEASERDWGPIEDMRLSEKDRNDAKTMNSHLHILEGYTALLRVWKDEHLRGQLHNLLNIFLEIITGADGHLQLFFDENWTRQGDVQSFGHDIEASWLMMEAAQVLEDPVLMEKTKTVCNKIAAAAMEGLMPDGGLSYEREGDRIDSDRHWWVQAECVVGCWNQWQLTGDEIWKERSEHAWKFIKKYIIREQGEWWWRYPQHPEDDLAGFWKCPYHNGRMCMELLERNDNPIK